MIDFGTLLYPLYYILGGFGVLILFMVAAAYVATKVAERRQAKWLKGAVKAAVFESNTPWQNRRQIKRIK